MPLGALNAWRLMLGVLPGAGAEGPLLYHDLRIAPVDSFIPGHQAVPDCKPCYSGEITAIAALLPPQTCAKGEYNSITYYCGTYQHSGCGAPCSTPEQMLQPVALD